MEWVLSHHSWVLCGSRRGLVTGESLQIARTSISLFSPKYNVILKHGQIWWQEGAWEQVQIFYWISKHESQTHLQTASKINIGENRSLKDQGLGFYVVLYFSLGSIFIKEVLQNILLHSSVITYFILIALKDHILSVNVHTHMAFYALSEIHMCIWGLNFFSKDSLKSFYRAVSRGRN